jgi:cytochrome c oxidase subunit 2
MKKSFRILGLFSSLLVPFTARASELHETLAAPWQLGFPKPASPVMEELVWLHNDFLLYIIGVITAFVLVLMVIIAIRFNRKANPVPSKTAHNTQLEILWTVVPIFILVAIAIPSLRAHYFIEDESNAEMTLKVLGYQWYWHYEYPDQGGFGFDSYMKKENELGPDEHRLLAVDNHVVVPVDTKIHVLLTGADVIHAWAVPAMGVKRDAVPGRLNESWFTANRTGRFYGQCSELCGVGHGFMPIVMDVVSKEEFATWVSQKQKEAGIASENGESEAQKVKRPIVEPASAEHKDPQPVIDKEKALSKPGASDNRPSGDAKGKDNQPEPSKAAPKKH